MSSKFLSLCNELISEIVLDSVTVDTTSFEALAMTCRTLNEICKPWMEWYNTTKHRSSHMYIGNNGISNRDHQYVYPGLRCRLRGMLYLATAISEGPQWTAQASLKSFNQNKNDLTPQLGFIRNLTLRDERPHSYYNAPTFADRSFVCSLPGGAGVNGKSEALIRFYKLYDILKEQKPDLYSEVASLLQKHFTAARSFGTWITHDVHEFDMYCWIEEFVLIVLATKLYALETCQLVPPRHPVRASARYSNQGPQRSPGVDNGFVETLSKAVTETWAKATIQFQLRNYGIAETFVFQRRINSIRRTVMVEIAPCQDLFRWAGLLNDDQRLHGMRIVRNSALHPLPTVAED